MFTYYYYYYKKYHFSIHLQQLPFRTKYNGFFGFVGNSVFSVSPFLFSSRNIPECLINTTLKILHQLHVRTSHNKYFQVSFN